MLANELIACIKKSETIALLPHINMDGDTIGSVLALYLALKKVGKDVKVIVEEEPIQIYEFFPSIEIMEMFREGESIPNFELVISVDGSDLGRLGKRLSIFEKGNVTANIDHHPTNTQFADFNHVVTHASATGEIMYQLIKMMDIPLDENIATCLYGAISSDTGGFRFANTSALTHIVASDLIQNGAQSSKVSVNLFENNSLTRLKIMGEVINRLEMHGDGRLSVMELPADLIERHHAKEEDIEGFSNLGRSIRGVEVAAFLREKTPGNIKVSLRGRDKADLSAVALRFGGGGHKRAAGFDYKGSMQEIKALLIKELLECLND